MYKQIETLVESCQLESSKPLKCEKEKIVLSGFMIACLSLSMKAQLVLCIKNELDVYSLSFALQH